ncbi:MAG: hypothetical protein A2104_02945, partial [Candidatus Melainabacteria bacterium GWF2_32_7]
SNSELTSEQKLQNQQIIEENQTKRNKHIFTREEIKIMSQEEFKKNENDINHQMETIGIPYQKELAASQKNTGDNIKSNRILEGYIWKSDSESCDSCQALNGKEFKTIDEIPDRPHPNCQCSIKEVTGELCDCIEFLDKIDELIGDGKSLKDEIIEVINELGDFLRENIIESAKNTIRSCVDGLKDVSGAVSDFISNYQDMKEANTIGADKYFHSKANCEAAQRGELGSAVAKGISDLREFTDKYKNIYLKGMSEAESARDSTEDQKANEYGRQQGCQYPNGDCGDIVDIYRPKDL